MVQGSQVEKRPLDIDLRPPLPTKIRLYAYRATSPAGGRPVAEYKIQLIVPGQRLGEKSTFDDAPGRILVLAGFVEEYDVVVLWDAGLYGEFTYNRNVQVRASTVYQAFAGKIAEQRRKLSRGEETVVACERSRLREGLRRRQELTLERLLRA